ncbi:hypothetical protein NLU13_0652 [Sarocladium strictum]|uniref:Folliculin-interacting protein N-terminal domain-containing protein n=1 Tax=Sarocladium strictum TaxID=5046 RepID=A0AA39GQ81_SARSR|nr:hypothetical protein NLU13_0652 [Sarocladium strictum]
MLGRLLHLGSGGSAPGQAQPQGPPSRPVASLESVHEDIHTRNLLFPDAHTLFQHRNDQVFPLSTAPTTPSTASPAAFDYTEDIGIDAKDVRVIIMQDALGPTNASLLFDSHPAPAVPQNERTSPILPQDSIRRTSVSRKGSLVGQSTRPVIIQGDTPQPRQGAFDRRGSLQGRAQSHAETEAQRAAREYREELATFSSCIFGNSELMSYKGTSTKVHVVPSDFRAPEVSLSSVLGDGRSSIGRSSARSSKLSQSFSSQAVSPSMKSPLSGYVHTPRYRKVLITRLFPVTLPVDDLDSSITPQSRFSDENSGFPFPQTGDDGNPKKKKPQPRQRRTPMYAIVLVVQLPASRVVTGPGRSGLRDSSSFTDGDLFPSSYSSARPSAWSMSGSGTLGDTADSIYSLDLEERIDLLTQHWDIIMRTMTHLQSVAASTIATMLRQADVASPDLGNQPSVTNLPGAAVIERRLPELRNKQPKSTTKLVSLGPNCLSENPAIAQEVEVARGRIVTGLCASRVVTGQGRWGIWRDEAIWASRWTANVDRDQFFYNLLTGFLATHTDWLQALCPPSYRRRFFLSRRKQSEEDLSLPSRTIIVSEDKMAARRLIFLLSAFLPANQHLPPTRAHRPSTSTSVGHYPNSPPTFVIPVLREESLRRRINRRAAPQRASHSRTASQSTRASAIPAQLAHLSMDRVHDRRSSDAASLRTASLAMPGNDIVSRKSSAATTTTIMPEATMPHITSVQRTDSRRRPRPGSSSSVAADDLKRTLTRGDSSGQGAADSRTTSQGSKWGSVISGLWSTRRRESSSLSTCSQNSGPQSPSAKMNIGRTERLSDMIHENSMLEDFQSQSTQRTPKASDARTVATTPREQITRTQELFPDPDRTPDPNGAFESPVKTSINVDDGVIDVDVPFPDYITSFESAISSPSSSGYLSTPGLPGGLDSFEHSARVTVDGDLPLNAAGWLRTFHPDFALQAIPPQDNLVEVVKAALRAEPTPAPVSSAVFEASGRWVDVGSVMIADTTSNTISRIVYRRLVKSKIPMDPSSTGNISSGLYGSSFLTPSILPYETPLDEEWIEEVVGRPDELLVDAMNKVMDLQQDSSKVSSCTSSHTASDHHLQEGHPSMAQFDGSQHSSRMPLEAPRVKCKTVVLSALEDTIRDVIEHRDKHEDGYTGPRQNLLRAAVKNWLAELDVLE